MDYIRYAEFLIKVEEDIRRIRTEKDISRLELPHTTEISRNQIGRIERGEINCGLSALYELSVGLGTPVYKLFEPLQSDMALYQHSPKDNLRTILISSSIFNPENRIIPLALHN